MPRPGPFVEAFRTSWRDGGRETYRLRLYRLDDLVVPDVPGESRLATAADDDLITEWWVRFVAELDGLEREEAEEVMRGSRAMPAGHVVWLVDGEPVSWAASTEPVAGVSRVGPVYTPPAQRGRGWASNAVAQVSRQIRAGGARVCLYTDQANPTSNKIYAALGYRPVADMANLVIVP